MNPLANRIAVGLGALLLAGGVLGLDETVVLGRPAGDSTPPPHEYGVLLFDTSTVQKFCPGASPINIQNPDSRLTSIVAFTKGLPPAIGTRTPGQGPTTLQFRPAIQIPIKVWVLCVNANCDGKFAEAFRDKLNVFLYKANHLFERERVGIVLTKAGAGSGGDDWISDQTCNTAKRDKFKNFQTGDGGDDCSQARLDELTGQMKDPLAFNMYAVGRVDGSAWRGESCGTYDIAVVAAATSWHTKLHEIGHNLGLQHVDGTDIQPYEPTENLMHKASSDRRFLSEGQIFLIHFDIQTALKEVFFAKVPADWPFRDCTDSPALCPPQWTWIWDDKD